MKVSFLFGSIVLIWVAVVVFYAMNNGYDSIKLGNPYWGQMEFERKVKVAE